MAPEDTYDSRFLAGIDHFNREEFFEAHEVWEDVWNDCEPETRRFYQALIQAAVSLYHGLRGNETGARRLFHSGRRYMQPYRPIYLGLHIDPFWVAIEQRLNDPKAAMPRIDLAEKSA